MHTAWSMVERRKPKTKFRFQDLEIWQIAIETADKLFDVANELEKKILYRFADQLRGAGMSMSNNIAEGSGSNSDKEFCHFLDIALIVDDDFDFIRNYDLPLVVASKLEGIVGTKIDVVLFNKMDSLFQLEIRVKGNLVYVRDRAKLKRVFPKARGEYEDYLHLHRYYIGGLKRRYKVHG